MPKIYHLDNEELGQGEREFPGFHQTSSSLLQSIAAFLMQHRGGSIMFRESTISALVSVLSSVAGAAWANEHIGPVLVEDDDKINAINTQMFDHIAEAIKNFQLKEPAQ